MKRIQNFLAMLTVGLIGCSGVSLIVGALSSAIGAETLVALFGYVGFYAVLAMLATSSTMVGVLLLGSGQKHLRRPML